MFGTQKRREVWFIHPSVPNSLSSARSLDLSLPRWWSNGWNTSFSISRGSAVQMGLSCLFLSRRPGLEACNLSRKEILLPPAQSGCQSSFFIYLSQQFFWRKDSSPFLFPLWADTILPWVPYYNWFLGTENSSTSFLWIFYPLAQWGVWFSYMIQFLTIFRVLLDKNNAQSNLIWIKWIYRFIYLEVQRGGDFRLQQGIPASLCCSRPCSSLWVAFRLAMLAFISMYGNVEKKNRWSFLVIF